MWLWRLCVITVDSVRGDPSRCFAGGVRLGRIPVGFFGCSCLDDRANGLFWRRDLSALRFGCCKHVVAGMHGVDVAGGSSGWPEDTFEISLGTTTAGKLLVALGLRSGAICAGNGCSSGMLGHQYVWYAITAVLVFAMDGVMALQKVTDNVRKAVGENTWILPARERHMARQALERFDVGVYTDQLAMSRQGCKTYE
jgi:hypothetical protein